MDGSGRGDGAELSAESEMGAEIDRLLCLPPRYGGAPPSPSSGG